MEHDKRSHREASPDAIRVIDVLLTAQSERTFGVHLGRVRERRLLGSEYCDIGEESNRGPTAFLHWMPGRFEVPKYNGLGATTSEGLRPALVDLTKAIRAVTEAIQGAPP